MAQRCAEGCRSEVLPEVSSITGRPCPEIEGKKAANLEGETVEWVTRLHDKEAPELGNINVFMGELRDRSKDKSQALQAKAEI